MGKDQQKFKNFARGYNFGTVFDLGVRQYQKVETAGLK
jgi:hypothetical protein